MNCVLYRICHEIGNLPSQRVLHHLVTTYLPLVICLAEPIVSFSSISDSFLSHLNLCLLVLNEDFLNVPTLWVFVSISLMDVYVLSLEEEHITLSYILFDQTHLFDLFLWFCVSCWSS